MRQRPGKLTDPAATGAARNCYIPMPFTRSARITLTNEGKQSSRHWVEINYRYQTEPHAPFPKLPSVEERTSWAAGVKGAIEGEGMKILSRTGGITEVQTEGRWSGSKQLWWHDAKVGDKLELALPVAKSGRYRLVMCNTLANDYGIFQFHLDGEKLCAAVDFSSATNTTKLITLGKRDLTEGEHRLTAEVVGTNPAAKPRFMLGLDYVKLELVR